MKKRTTRKLFPEDEALQREIARRVEEEEPLGDLIPAPDDCQSDDCDEPILEKPFITMGVVKPDAWPVRWARKLVSEPRKDKKKGSPDRPPKRK